MAKEDEGLGKDVTDRRCKKWLEAKHILLAELINFMGRMDIRYGRKRKVNDDLGDLLSEPSIFVGGAGEVETDMFKKQNGQCCLWSTA